jgi:hypothetical protein
VLAPDLSSNCYSMLDVCTYPPLKAPNTEAFGAPISFRCLIICFGIGQFARLLPSVEVVAISPLDPTLRAGVCFKHPSLPPSPPKLSSSEIECCTFSNESPTEFLFEAWVSPGGRLYLKLPHNSKAERAHQHLVCELHGALNTPLGCRLSNLK